MELIDFSRNSRELIEQLHQSGRPEVLTIDGRPEVVVQSAEAYQQLLQDHDQMESIRGIARGLQQADRNEGRPMRRFVEELASKHGIPLK